MEPRYGLASTTWGPEELRAIDEVVKGGSFTMGRHVREFEEAFAARFGRKYAVMVNSGSSANLVAVAALCYRKQGALRPGDEVIVPSISWATTYHPLHQYGLRMKFVDVELETLNMDVAGLERAITEKTRMVVAVSILGNPCRLDEIRRICDERGIILFEDNCESMGATLGGRFTGGFGLVGTFSTFFSHHISTMEGGLAVTDDKEIFNLLKAMRSHGWTRDQDADSPLYERRLDDFFESYRFILPGYNVRPGEMHGAIGKEQLKKLDGFLLERRRNAAHFVSLFKDDHRFIIQREVGSSSWFCFTMIVRPDRGLDRDRVLSRLKEAGIEHRIITGGNILRHDVARYYDCTDTGTPNADLAHYQGFFVGNHPRDIRGDIDYLHETLKTIP